MLNAIVKNRLDDYVQCFARTSTPTAENKNIFCDHFSRSVSVSALGSRNNNFCALFRAWSLGNEGTGGNREHPAETCPEDHDAFRADSWGTSLE